MRWNGSIGDDLDLAHDGQEGVGDEEVVDAAGGTCCNARWYGTIAEDAPVQVVSEVRGPSDRWIHLPVRPDDEGHAHGLDINTDSMKEIDVGPREARAHLKVQAAQQEFVLIAWDFENCRAGPARLHCPYRPWFRVNCTVIA